MRQCFGWNTICLTLYARFHKQSKLFIVSRLIAFTKNHVFYFLYVLNYEIVSFFVELLCTPASFLTYTIVCFQTASCGVFRHKRLLLLRGKAPALAQFARLAKFLTKERKRGCFSAERLADWRQQNVDPTFPFVWCAQGTSRRVSTAHSWSWLPPLKGFATRAFYSQRRESEALYFMCAVRIGGHISIVSK